MLEINTFVSTFLPYHQTKGEADCRENCLSLRFFKFNTAGLEITAGQRTMSGLIVDLTGQTFVLPVMLIGQNSIVLKLKSI